MKSVINKIGICLVALVLVMEFVLIIAGGFGLFSELPTNTANAVILYTLIGWIVPAMFGYVLTEMTETIY